MFISGQTGPSTASLSVASAPGSLSDSASCQLEAKTREDAAPGKGEERNLRLHLPCLTTVHVFPSARQKRSNLQLTVSHDHHECKSKLGSTVAMFEFSSPTSQAKLNAPRTGKIVCNSAFIRTPCLIASTSRGVIPHVSQDLVHSSTSVQSAYVALEDCAFSA